MKRLYLISGLYIIGLIVISTPLAAQQTIAGAPVHLTVKRMNDSYIDAYYNQPQNGARLPLFIFCQGSGYDSNSAGFLSLFKKFDKQVVGLVIEKQGVKYGDHGDTLTKEYTANNMVYNRLNDYLRVLQYLRKNADWWNGKLYVIGGSEGGLLAGMLACYYPDVTAVGIFSFGGGLNFGEAWPISSGMQKKQEGAGDAAIAKEISAVKDSLDYIRDNPVKSKSYSGDDNTYAWWASIMDLRLENALLDVTIPVYLVQGSEDIMAPPVSARKLRDDFSAAGKRNLYYREYEGYDHEYKDAAKKSHLVEVIMQTIQQMLEKNHPLQ